MKIDIKIVVVLAIAALEAEAMYLGINGAIFGLVVAALAGLGGYELKVLRNGR